MLQQKSEAFDMHDRRYLLHTFWIVEQTHRLVENAESADAQMQAVRAFKPVRLFLS